MFPNYYRYTRFNRTLTFLKKGRSGLAILCGAKLASDVTKTQFVAPDPGAPLSGAAGWPGTSGPPCWLLSWGNCLVVDVFTFGAWFRFERSRLPPSIAIIITKTTIKKIVTVFLFNINTSFQGFIIHNAALLLVTVSRRGRLGINQKLFQWPKRPRVRDQWPQRRQQIKNLTREKL